MSGRAGGPRGGGPQRVTPGQPGTAGPASAAPVTPGTPGMARHGLAAAGPAAAEPAAPGPTAPGPAAAGRRRGPRDPWKTAFVVLALAGIVAGVAWALLDSRFFVVRSVTVTGVHRVTRAQVLAAARIPAGLPLVRVDTAAVGRRVDAITQVRSAQVSRSWPDAVVIHVTERTPVLAVRDGRGYELVDGAGVAVTSASRRPAQMPLLRTSGPLRGSPAVAAAAAVTGELPPQLRQRLDAVTADNANDVTLHLNGGVTIAWGSPGHAAVKTRILAALMRTHARFYDVSSSEVVTTR